MTPVHRDCIPKITFGGEQDYRVLYEGVNAYRPKPTGNWDVYFYTVSGYWKFINECSKEDFNKFIKPRI